MSDLDRTGVAQNTHPALFELQLAAIKNNLGLNLKFIRNRGLDRPS